MPDSLQRAEEQSTVRVVPGLRSSTPPHPPAEPSGTNVEGPLYMCISTAPARHACPWPPRGATDDVLEGSGKRAGRQGPGGGREKMEEEKNSRLANPIVRRQLRYRGQQSRERRGPAGVLETSLVGPLCPAQGWRRLCWRRPRTRPRRGGTDDGKTFLMDWWPFCHQGAVATVRWSWSWELLMRYCRLAANAEMRLM